MPKFDLPQQQQRNLADDDIRIKMRLLTHKPGRRKPMALDKLTDASIVKLYHLIKKRMPAHKITQTIQGEWGELTTYNAGSLAQSILRLRRVILEQEDKVALTDSEFNLLDQSLHESSVELQNQDGPAEQPEEFDVLARQEALVNDIQNDLDFWKAKAKDDPTEQVFKHVRELTTQLQKALQEHVKLRKELAALPKDKNEGDPLANFGQDFFTLDNPDNPNDPDNPADMTPHTNPPSKMHNEIFGHTPDNPTRSSDPGDAGDGREPTAEQEGEKLIQ